MKQVLVIAACGLMLSACATVTRGRHEQWLIQSSPPEATVKTSLGHTCTTPCSLRLPREAVFTATVSKPHYDPVTVSVSHHMELDGGVAFAGNVLIGGLVGVVTDANTGATQSLTPNPTVVRLQLSQTSPYYEPPKGRTAAD